MPTVNELLTNYNSGNYHGRLHYLTPEDTPFATMLGGFAPGGGQVATARTFEWQTTDLRAGSATAQVPDAADAPSPENRRRESVFNVIETHTDTVGVGFERMAQHGQFNVPGTSAQDAQNIDQGSNPITSELPWQIEQMWKQIKRDVEQSLINGTYNLPTSNAANARTRGIIQAIATNEVDASNATDPADPLTFLNVERAMQLGYDNGGLMEGETRVLMVPSIHKRQLSWDYHKRGLAPRSRTVYGVNVETVETSFGNLNVALNRHIPNGTALVLDFSHLVPWFRMIPPHDDVPGGVSFSYSKARTGNRTEQVLYTSIGLEYGNEKAHAKITGLSTDQPTDA